MFADADLETLYQWELHAHDVPLINQLLAEAQGRDFHVISRVDDPPEPMLPWEDAWLFTEAH
ncbi:MAG: hypothetical protein NUW01_06610 [Gemmatimonadaceae bacterium]|nr:hypothetical protein [Gemmatimonadaceae bacterium]